MSEEFPRVTEKPKDIRQPYLLDERGKADATLAIREELPRGFVAENSPYDPTAKNKRGRMMHHCPSCGGWIQGKPLRFEKSTGHECLSGMTWITRFCRRCATEIGERIFFMS